MRAFKVRRSSVYYRCEQQQEGCNEQVALETQIHQDDTVDLLHAVKSSLKCVKHGFICYNRKLKCPNKISQAVHACRFRVKFSQRTADSFASYHSVAVVHER